MTNNLMEQYVKNTKTCIKNFTKMFFAEEYDEKISNEYIDTYIDARVYNFGNDSQRFFYRRIYESLLDKKKKMDKEYKKTYAKIIDENLKLYQYIFYIDGVRPIEDLKVFCKDLCEKRKTTFDLEAIRGLEGRILKLIKQYNDQKEKFNKQYETKDFELNIEKYTLVDNTYKVDLSYTFKVPYIYSKQVISEVFNGGVINEDKLIVEYTLLTLECIKDIDIGNFEKKYLVNFADTLFKKQVKLKQTLKVLANEAAQDKVYLKIKYADFEEYKEIVYTLMQDGYRFAIIIDDTFTPTAANFKKMGVFKYLLVARNSKNYDNIKYNEDKIDNIVIYDL